MKLDNRTPPMGKLTKVSDEKFGGDHPNGVNPGYTKEGIILQHPKVGNRAMVGSVMTSRVTEIVSEDNTEVMFKTENSTYKLEIL